MASELKSHASEYKGQMTPILREDMDAMSDDSSTINNYNYERVNDRDLKFDNDVCRLKEATTAPYCFAVNGREFNNSQQDGKYFKLHIRWYNATRQVGAYERSVSTIWQHAILFCMVSSCIFTRKKYFISNILVLRFAIRSC